MAISRNDEIAEYFYKARQEGYSFEIIIFLLGKRGNYFGGFKTELLLYVIWKGF